MPGTVWCKTFMGARDRTRTDKDVNPIEPETIASTNFATRANRAQVTHFFCNSTYFSLKKYQNGLFLCVFCHLGAKTARFPPHFRPAEHSIPPPPGITKGALLIPSSCALLSLLKINQKAFIYPKKNYGFQSMHQRTKSSSLYLGNVHIWLSTMSSSLSMW